MLTKTSHHLTSLTITLLILLILMIGLLIGASIFLILTSHVKRQKIRILQNLEYYHSINLHNRLKRINLITKNNPQYQTICHIWVNRYYKLLTNNCQSIVKSYQQVIRFEANKTFSQRNRLLKDTYTRSNHTKNLLKKLVTEIDYFISVDQLIREYQLFFKQNFNYLQAEAVKNHLENQINEEQLTTVTSTLAQKFKDLTSYIDEANLNLVVNCLSEIAIGTTVLAEILVNLPKLSHQVNILIPNKLLMIRKQIEFSFRDTNLIESFNPFELEIKQKLLTVKQLINNLQYKKSKNLITEILTSVKKFNFNLQEEENFSTIFINNYKQYLSLNLNLNKIFEQINAEFDNINSVQKGLKNQTQISDLAAIIKKQLNALNQSEMHLTLELEKQIKTLTYHQLLMMLQDLIENNLITFNSLWNYNQALITEIKPQIMATLAINKLHSIMIQIENILSNQNYHFLSDKYRIDFTNLQQKFYDISTNDHQSVDIKHERMVEQIADLQSSAFQQYQQLKINIAFHNLANAALVYANRFRKDEELINNHFQKIELLLKQRQYQQSLEGIIKLLK